MGFFDLFKNKESKPMQEIKPATQAHSILQVEEVKPKGLSEHQEEYLIDYYAKQKSGYTIEDVDMGRPDPLFEDAAHLAVIHQQGSTSLIQRKFAIGYNRAGRIMDQLENAGIVGKESGSKAREVFILCENDLELNLKLRSQSDISSIDNKVIQQFIIEHSAQIEEKSNYYRSLIQKEKEEQERAEIEYQKEIIKQEIIERKKRQEIRNAALKELEEEGVLESSKKREPIPQGTQDIVWNRDGGCCVKCGSQENLEFDHIIPFSKGGSNSARNLQLLCQKCNREKSNKIG